jgi:hypothetical protein
MIDDEIYDQDLLYVEIIMILTSVDLLNMNEKIYDLDSLCVDDKIYCAWMIKIHCMLMIR